MLYFFVVRIKNMGDDEIVGSRSTIHMQLPLKKKDVEIDIGIMPFHFFNIMIS